MRFCVAALVVFAAACSRTGLHIGGGSSSSSSAASVASSSSSSSSASTGGSGGAGGSGGEGATGGAPVLSDLFAQSPNTLYRLDAITKELHTVGDFVGCDGPVIDIAIDQKGRLFGTTFGGFYRIDTGDGSCTPMGMGLTPTSLAFVPPGTLDPTEEALVGFDHAAYVRFDPETGDSVVIGDLSSPGYESSGDVVAVAGGGTYLSAKGNGCSDCLIEVDPVTGALLGIVADLQYSDVFGLAYYDGIAYGFTGNGELFQVELATGETTPLVIANPPANLGFYGAASPSGPLPE